MAKKPRQARRKLVEFDAETWRGLDLLARKTMKSLQELADEASATGYRNMDGQST
jgi:hypothetical protein